MVNTKADIVILNANELLTMKGTALPRAKEQLSELGIIEGGGLAIKDGRIAAVGNSRMIKDRFGKGAKTVIDAKDKIVMPGFVDCHNHLIFEGSRENELEWKIKGHSYIDITKRGGGIRRTVKETRGASLESLIASAKKRLDVMMKFGTTTTEAKSGYGLNLKDEVKMLNAIRKLDEMHLVDLVPTFLGAHALPPEFKDFDKYTNVLIEKILPVIAEKKLAEFCDVFCEIDFFSVDQSRKILLRAKSLGMKPKVHADEFAETGGAELSAEVHAITAEHINYPSPRGLKKMADHGVIGVLLPASSYSMMSSNYADARRIIDAGVPVALGTDLTPNSWSESMQFVVSQACYNMRMLPSEAICAATINAAFAVGRGSEVGSLEEGKFADVIILDVPNYRHIPYHFGVNLVEQVIKKGEIAV